MKSSGLPMERAKLIWIWRRGAERTDVKDNLVAIHSALMEVEEEE